jgi:hypothetical protein
VGWTSHDGAEFAGVLLYPTRLIDYKILFVHC